MYSSIMSAAISGLTVTDVRVETDMGDGLPLFTMVGCLSSQIREAEARVRSAFRNLRFSMPAKRITVNLSPADLPKSSSRFDLPIALTILAASGLIPEESLHGVMAVGELSLSGELLRIKGVLPIAMKAKETDIRLLIVPQSNEAEARAVDDIAVIGLGSLTDAVDFFRNGCLPDTPAAPARKQKLNIYTEDFSDIRGQSSAKRAALISAAGFHNLILIGAPGSGKTMIARRMPTILPSLTREESLEISRIYSIAGLTDDSMPLIGTRPFRHPHHTISPQALAGGGKIPSPGEVSLAHRGILFLDEMPEFQQKTIEILRQPLEDREIIISRSAGSFCFPANFLLLAAMNPGPCGCYPDMNRCTCTPRAVTEYRNRISGPLLDRIDLSVQCPPVTYEDLSGERARASSVSSAQLRAQVETVREIQRDRFKGTSLHFNSEIPSSEISRYCAMSPAAETALEHAFRSGSLSARSYYRIIRVARTIADLDNSPGLLPRHVDEALTYRPLDSGFWRL